MLNHIRTKTGVITVVCTLLIYIYNRTTLFTPNTSSCSHEASDDLSKYSEELSELRHDLNILKKKIAYIEQSLTSSTLLSTILPCVQTIVSRLTSLSSSFILYSFFLYLFHLCVFNPSTTQTIKLLHVINIISYSLISILYTSLQHVHYSYLAWLLFVLLFVRIYIY